MFEYGGYLGLFLAAFGAATLLPMQSEAVLGGLLIGANRENGKNRTLRFSGQP